MNKKKIQNWKNDQKIIFQQPKVLENTNVVEIKSAIIKYPKTSHKLSKNTIHVERVSQGFC